MQEHEDGRVRKDDHAYCVEMLSNWFCWVIMQCEGHMLNLWVHTSRVENRSQCRGGRQGGEVTFAVVRSGQVSWSAAMVHPLTIFLPLWRWMTGSVENPFCECVCG